MLSSCVNPFVLPLIMRLCNCKLLMYCVTGDIFHPFAYLTICENWSSPSSILLAKSARGQRLEPLDRDYRRSNAPALGLDDLLDQALSAMP